MTPKINLADFLGARFIVDTLVDQMAAEILSVQPMGNGVQYAIWVLAHYDYQPKFNILGEEDMAKPWQWIHRVYLEIN